METPTWSRQSIQGDEALKRSLETIMHGVAGKQNKQTKVNQNVLTCVYFHV